MIDPPADYTRLAFLIAVAGLVIAVVGLLICLILGVGPFAGAPPNMSTGHPIKNIVPPPPRSRTSQPTSKPTPSKASAPSSTSPTRPPSHTYSDSSTESHSKPQASAPSSSSSSTPTAAPQPTPTPVPIRGKRAEEQSTLHDELYQEVPIQDVVEPVAPEDMEEVKRMQHEALELQRAQHEHGSHLHAHAHPINQGRASSHQAVVTSKPEEEVGPQNKFVSPIAGSDDHPRALFRLSNVFTNASITARDLLFFMEVPRAVTYEFEQIISKAFGPRPANDVSTISPLCASDANCRDRTLSTRVGPRYDPTFSLLNRKSLTPGQFQDLINPYDIGLGFADASVSKVLKHRPRVMLMTMLRKPVDRFVSFYEELRENSDNIYKCMRDKSKGVLDDQMDWDCRDPTVRQYLQRFSSIAGLEAEQQREMATALTSTGSMTPLSLTNLDAKSFLTFQKTTEMDNYMTRMLLGATRFGFQPVKIREAEKREMVEKAKNTLRNMPFFGLAERYHDSVKLFLYTFGFDTRRAASLVKAIPKAEETIDLSELDLERTEIEDAEWMDMELYQFARNLFEQRMELMRKKLEQFDFE